MRKIAVVSIFSFSFAFVESSIVIYLRSIYYPDGFSFPLRMMSPNHLSVELVREFSTIVMLAAVGMLAGTGGWVRFGFFLIAFGSWDIFYYGWLKVLLNWPATLLDWDILFLIPYPWIGPVIAPITISLLMIAAGILIVRKEERGITFRPTFPEWLFSILGTGFILLSFLIDTDAALRFQTPKPFRYELFISGVILYLLALVVMTRRSNFREATDKDLSMEK